MSLDAVIVPAYTYTASASVVAHVGATIILVDSQKDNVEMDYDKLADAITERTKCCTRKSRHGGVEKD